MEYLLYSQNGPTHKSDHSWGPKQWKGVKPHGVGLSAVNAYLSVAERLVVHLDEVAALRAVADSRAPLA